MDQRQEVTRFIEELLHRKGDDLPFGDADSLILGGRLESIDAVEIVMFLESQFGLNFADIGFDQAQIDSIQTILDLIKSNQPK